MRRKKVLDYYHILLASGWDRGGIGVGIRMGSGSYPARLPGSDARAVFGPAKTSYVGR